MTEVDLYDGYYGNLDADPHAAVRRLTYDEDLGQASWITLAEAQDMFRALELGPGQTALEVACGSGGVTCRMATETGAQCVGIDEHCGENDREGAETWSGKNRVLADHSFQV